MSYPLPQAWRGRGVGAGDHYLLSLAVCVTQFMSQQGGLGVSEGGRRLEVGLVARIELDHKRTWFVRLAEWGSRRKYGKVMDPGRVALHNRGVLVSTLLLEGSAARWKTLDPGLKALAVMVVSARIGCSWCMDFGYWEFHHQGVDPAKLRDVPGWRDSDVYSDLERAVMDYAEAMTATPPEVTDEQVSRLRQDLSDEQLVELTALASLENFRSRTNAALGLTSQGFKEYCELRPAR